MKHAFLIIAHGNWEQLVVLLKQIDDTHNDVYIHIDAKVKDVPYEMLSSALVHSKLKIYSKYKVYWGSFELLQVELLLLKEAINEKYDYYHLLSGMDLMIKSKQYFFNFFEKNKGYEFVHFESNDRLINDKEILRRVKCYHFFTNYRRRFKNKFLNNLFDFIEHCSLGIQILLCIDRTKKYDYTIKYGSQWFSITYEFAQYIISKEKEIYKIFYKTKCCDELFVQTILFNSKFEKNLFNRKYDGSCMGNVRLIDINVRGSNGSPYVWNIHDLDELKKSKCIFARKFDLNKDCNIVSKITDITKEDQNGTD